MNHIDFLQRTIDLANESINNGRGPFAAIVVDQKENPHCIFPFSVGFCLWISCYYQLRLAPPPPDEPPPPPR